MPVKFKELVSKLTEYQDMFHHLRKAVNDELGAFLQYTAGNGVCKSDRIKKEFDEHAKEEYNHALMFYTIIQELGGVYVLDPHMMLINNDCGFTPPFGDSIKIIEDNIKGEQCAIASYSTLLTKFDFSKKHKDVIQSIIDDEKKHVQDLVKLKKLVKDEPLHDNKN